MSHIASPTKQTLQSLHAASQLDFATLANVAAVNQQQQQQQQLVANSALGHPNTAFYYGNGYAESIAPSHHSTYQYYDDDEGGWEMPNFYNETYMKDSLHQANNNNNNIVNGQQQQQLQKQNGSQLQPQQTANIYGNGQQVTMHQQQQQQQQLQQNDNNKDELYDRLKRHLYTGKKGDTSDSEEAQ